MGLNTSSDIGVLVRSPGWDAVARHLEQARSLLPVKTPLLAKPGQPDPAFLHAHDTLGGVPPRRKPFADMECGEREQMLGHIYAATREALIIAVELQESAALDGRSTTPPQALLEWRSLREVLRQELGLIHRYSELLGLCDPAGQLMEIHEIAWRVCRLPGTDPVLRHVNAMAGGANLDFDVDDPFVARIRRTPQDDRVTAAQLEAQQSEGGERHSRMKHPHG